MLRKEHSFFQILALLTCDFARTFISSSLLLYLKNCMHVEFMHVLVSMHTGRHTCACGCVCAGHRSGCLCIHCVYFESRSLTEPGVRGVCLSPRPASTGVTGTCHHIRLLCGYWGSEQSPHAFEIGMRTLLMEPSPQSPFSSSLKKRPQSLLRQEA